MTENFPKSRGKARNNTRLKLNISQEAAIFERKERKNLQDFQKRHPNSFSLRKDIIYDSKNNENEDLDNQKNNETKKKSDKNIKSNLQIERNKIVTIHRFFQFKSLEEVNVPPNYQESRLFVKQMSEALNQVPISSQNINDNNSKHNDITNHNIKFELSSLETLSNEIDRALHFQMSDLTSICSPFDDAVSQRNEQIKKIGYSISENSLSFRQPFNISQLEVFHQEEDDDSKEINNYQSTNSNVFISTEEDNNHSHKYNDKKNQISKTEGRKVKIMKKRKIPMKISDAIAHSTTNNVVFDISVSSSVFSIAQDLQTPQILTGSDSMNFDSPKNILKFGLSPVASVSSIIMDDDEIPTEIQNPFNTHESQEVNDEITKYQQKEYQKKGQMVEKVEKKNNFVIDEINKNVIIPVSNTYSLSFSMTETFEKYQKSIPLKTSSINVNEIFEPIPHFKESEFETMTSIKLQKDHLKLVLEEFNDTENNYFITPNHSTKNCRFVTSPPSTMANVRFSPQNKTLKTSNSISNEAKSDINLDPSLISLSNHMIDSIQGQDDLTETPKHEKIKAKKPKFMKKLFETSEPVTMTSIKLVPPKLLLETSPAMYSNDNEVDITQMNFNNEEKLLPKPNFATISPSTLINVRKCPQENISLTSNFLEEEALHLPKNSTQIPTFITSDLVTVSSINLIHQSNNIDPNELIMDNSPQITTQLSSNETKRIKHQKIQTNLINDTTQGAKVNTTIDTDVSSYNQEILNKDKNLKTYCDYIPDFKLSESIKIISIGLIQKEKKLKTSNLLLNETLPINNLIDTNSEGEDNKTNKSEKSKSSKNALTKEFIENIEILPIYKEKRISTEKTDLSYQVNNKNKRKEPIGKFSSSKLSVLTNIQSTNYSDSSAQRNHELKKRNNIIKSIHESQYFSLEENYSGKREIVLNNEYIYIRSYKTIKKKPKNRSPSLIQSYNSLETHTYQISEPCEFSMPNKIIQKPKLTLSSSNNFENNFTELKPTLIVSLSSPTVSMNEPPQSILTTKHFNEKDDKERQPRKPSKVKKIDVSTNINMEKRTQSSISIDSNNIMKYDYSNNPIVLSKSNFTSIVNIKHLKNNENIISMLSPSTSKEVLETSTIFYNEFPGNNNHERNMISQLIFNKEQNNEALIPNDKPKETISNNETFTASDFLVITSTNNRLLYNKFDISPINHIFTNQENKLPITKPENEIKNKSTSLICELVNPGVVNLPPTEITKKKRLKSKNNASLPAKKPLKLSTSTSISFSANYPINIKRKKKPHIIIDDYQFFEKIEPKSDKNSKTQKRLGTRNPENPITQVEKREMSTTVNLIRKKKVYKREYTVFKREREDLSENTNMTVIMFDPIHIDVGQSLIMHKKSSYKQSTNKVDVKNSGNKHSFTISELASISSIDLSANDEMKAQNEQEFNFIDQYQSENSLTFIPNADDHLQIVPINNNNDKYLKRKKKHLIPETKNDFIHSGEKQSFTEEQTSQTEEINTNLMNSNKKKSIKMINNDINNGNKKQVIEENKVESKQKIKTNSVEENIQVNQTTEGVVDLLNENKLETESKLKPNRTQKDFVPKDITMSSLLSIISLPEKKQKYSILDQAECNISIPQQNVIQFNKHPKSQKQHKQKNSLKRNNEQNFSHNLNQNMKINSLQIFDQKNTGCIVSDKTLIPRMTTKNDIIFDQFSEKMVKFNKKTELIFHSENSIQNKSHQFRISNFSPLSSLQIPEINNKRSPSLKYETSIIFSKSFSKDSLPKISTYKKVAFQPGKFNESEIISFNRNDEIPKNNIQNPNLIQKAKEEKEKQSKMPIQKKETSKISNKFILIENNPIQNPYSPKINLSNLESITTIHENKSEDYVQKYIQTQIATDEKQTNFKFYSGDSFEVVKPIDSSTKLGNIQFEESNIVAVSISNSLDLNQNPNSNRSLSSNPNPKLTKENLKISSSKSFEANKTIKSSEIESNSSLQVSSSKSYNNIPCKLEKIPPSYIISILPDIRVNRNSISNSLSFEVTDNIHSSDFSPQLDSLPKPKSSSYEFKPQNKLDISMQKPFTIDTHSRGSLSMVFGSIAVDLNGNDEQREKTRKPQHQLLISNSCSKDCIHVGDEKSCKLDLQQPSSSTIKNKVYDIKNTISNKIEFSQSLDSRHQFRISKTAYDIQIPLSSTPLNSTSMIATPKLDDKYLETGVTTGTEINHKINQTLSQTRKDAASLAKEETKLQTVFGCYEIQSHVDLSQPKTHMKSNSLVKATVVSLNPEKFEKVQEIKIIPFSPKSYSNTFTQTENPNKSSNISKNKSSNLQIVFGSFEVGTPKENIILGKKETDLNVKHRHYSQISSQTILPISKFDTAVSSFNIDSEKLNSNEMMSQQNILQNNHKYETIFGCFEIQNYETVSHKIIESSNHDLDESITVSNQPIDVTNKGSELKLSLPIINAKSETNNYKDQSINPNFEIKQDHCIQQNENRDANIQTTSDEKNKYSITSDAIVNISKKNNNFEYLPISSTSFIPDISESQTQTIPSFEFIPKNKLSECNNVAFETPLINSQDDSLTTRKTQFIQSPKLREAPQAHQFPVELLNEMKNSHKITRLVLSQSHFYNIPLEENYINTKNKQIPLNTLQNHSCLIRNKISLNSSYCNSFEFIQNIPNNSKFTPQSDTFVIVPSSSHSDTEFHSSTQSNNSLTDHQNISFYNTPFNFSINHQEIFNNEQHNQKHVDGIETVIENQSMNSSDENHVNNQPSFLNYYRSFVNSNYKEKTDFSNTLSFEFINKNDIFRESHEPNQIFNSCPFSINPIQNHSHTFYCDQNQDEEDDNEIVNPDNFINRDNFNVFERKLTIEKMKPMFILLVNMHKLEEEDISDITEDCAALNKFVSPNLEIFNDVELCKKLIQKQMGEIKMLQKSLIKKDVELKSMTKKFELFKESAQKTLANYFNESRILHESNAKLTSQTQSLQKIIDSKYKAVYSLLKQKTVGCKLENISSIFSIEPEVKIINPNVLVSVTIEDISPNISSFNIQYSKSPNSHRRLYLSPTSSISNSIIPSLRPSGKITHVSEPPKRAFVPLKVDTTQILDIKEKKPNLSFSFSHMRVTRPKIFTNLHLEANLTVAHLMISNRFMNSYDSSKIDIKRNIDRFTVFTSLNPILNPSSRSISSQGSTFSLQSLDLNKIDSDFSYHLHHNDDRLQWKKNISLKIRKTQAISFIAHKKTTPK
ncbi:hypothetical protein TRFO_08816 [Tritrichomonas foetus]|uniref:Uncharacterized protein n=1 Tax=Tritrichomonas foetus TaxID=1144522 RepID=A0A1J4JLY3_9EUKA|nr:hypothetical protein TRFO_08816 [Tritrichomonas foetus]|eukprot:OHS98541.1 hypothetical protein TRFO_08816 [Tritrichomonas foetus]